MPYAICYMLRVGLREAERVAAGLLDHVEAARGPLPHQLL